MYIELSKTTWSDLKENLPDVVILPWGSTEAQGYHLPYSADTIEAEEIAKKSVFLANQNGAKSIVLPSFPFGVNSAQTDVPLTISILPSTQFYILRDIVKSIEKQGIKKLIIINAHGGNQFVPPIRELFNESEVFICLINTPQVLKSNDFFEIIGEHADERITSILKYLKPELVKNEIAPNYQARKFNIDELNQGWAWAQRKWTDITENHQIGDSSKANEEKGEKYIKAITKKISQLIINISKADLQDLYK